MPGSVVGINSAPGGIRTASRALCMRGPGLPQPGLTTLILIQYRSNQATEPAARQKAAKWEPIARAKG